MPNRTNNHVLRGSCRTHHRKGRQDNLQGPTDLGQVRLVNIEAEVEAIIASRGIARFAVHANMAFSVAREGERNLPFHGGKAGDTIKSPAQAFDLLQECSKFFRPQVSRESAPKTASDNLNFTCDPVPVPVVEEAWVMARKRSNDDVLSILVANHEFGAGCHRVSECLTPSFSCGARVTQIFHKMMPAPESARTTKLYDLKRSEGRHDPESERG